MMSDETSGEFWEKRWEGLQPGQKFDASKPHPMLVELVKSRQLTPPKDVFIPGCGRGYEVLFLEKKGFNVIGMDLAHAGVAAAKEYMAANDGDPERIVQGDFFDRKCITRQFDVVVDYTFRCALGPSMHKAWTERMSELVAPGGLLIMFIFPLKPFASTPGGRPYLQEIEEIVQLNVAAGFEQMELIESLPEELCHAGRYTYSGLGIFRRTAV